MRRRGRAWRPGRAGAEKASSAPITKPASICRCCAAPISRCGGGDRRAGRPVGRRQVDAAPRCPGSLEHPDGGEVWIDGRECGALADGERTEIRCRQLGFVYQFHHLLPEFSALENVVVPQMIAGVPRGQGEGASPARSLAMVGLAKRETHRPARSPAASSSASRSSAPLPTIRRILLGDEPTGNLDLHTGDEVMASLNRDRPPHRPLRRSSRRTISTLPAAWTASSRSKRAASSRAEAHRARPILVQGVRRGAEMAQQSMDRVRGRRTELTAVVRFAADEKDSGDETAEKKRRHKRFHPRLPGVFQPT